MRAEPQAGKTPAPQVEAGLEAALEARGQQTEADGRHTCRRNSLRQPSHRIVRKTAYGSYRVPEPKFQQITNSEPQALKRDQGFSPGGTTEVVPFPFRTTALPGCGYKRSAILLAIFLAASALMPASRRSIVTSTSPFRIMRDEFPAAR